MTLIRIALILLVCPAVSGCFLPPAYEESFNVTLRTWEDPDLVDLKKKLKSKVSLRVVLLDERPEKYHSGMLRIFMSYIPLLPYYSLAHERLDDVTADLNRGLSDRQLDQWRDRGGPPLPAAGSYSYPAAMARAIADDFRFYLRSASHSTGSRGWTSGYVLRGKLVSTRIGQWGTSYCLGPLGVLLWPILPLGGVNAETIIDFVLEDSQGETIWTGTLDGRARKLVHISTMVPEPSTPYGFELGLFAPSRLATPNVQTSSMFYWNFAALENGLRPLKREILEAIARHERRKSR